MGKSSNGCASTRLQRPAAEMYKFIGVSLHRSEDVFKIPQV